MSNRGLRVGLFLAAAGAVSGARAAVATPGFSATDPKNTIVRYHVDDLATSEGAKNLYEDLSRAARFVCGETGEFDLARSFEACERTAIAKAVSEVSSANLTTEFNRHFPNEPLIEKETLSQTLRRLMTIG